MESERKNLVKVVDLKKDDKLIKTVKYRPDTSIFMSMAIAISLIVLGIIYKNGIWILGALILPVSLFVAIKVKNYVQMEFFENYFVVYRKDDEFCQKFSYSEIKQWKIKSSKTSGDALIIDLGDDNWEVFETFHAPTVYKIMNKKLPDSEETKVRNKKYSSRLDGIKWPWKKDKK